MIPSVCMATPHLSVWNHEDYGCETVIICTKILFPLDKYCKNCVFKLSECSCEVFFIYVLAFKTLPLDICIWDHRIFRVGRGFMISFCSRVNWGQSRFFRALSNLVLKTPNMIISCIPKIACNYLKDFLWLNIGKMWLNGFCVHLGRRKVGDRVYKATIMYQMTPSNLTCSIVCSITWKQKRIL